MKDFEQKKKRLEERLKYSTPESLYRELKSYSTVECNIKDSYSEIKQEIQNFLNCCIMETQGNALTHNDLSKLLEFYFNDEMYCEGLSCYKELE